jgi:hypothetical protein
MARTTHVTNARDPADGGQSSRPRPLPADGDAVQHVDDDARHHHRPPRGPQQLDRPGVGGVVWGALVQSPCTCLKPGTLLTPCTRFGQSSPGFLPRDQAEANDLPDHDYWLFDSSKLIRMIFDDAARFLGGEIIDDPAEVVQHNYWRDAAWHHAIRRDDFATEQHLWRV